MELSGEFLEGIDTGKQYKTSVPFSGFYESLHELIFDSVLDDEINQLKDKLGRDPIEDFKIDFRGFALAYSKQYCLEFGQYLFLNGNIDFEIDLTFETLTSPREYNFETDRIFATISGSHLLRLFCFLDKSNFAEYLRENFTDESGFVSFYSSDIDNWLEKPLASWDCNEIGALLGRALEQVEVGYCESMQCENGHEIASDFIETSIVMANR